MPAAKSEPNCPATSARTSALREFLAQATGSVAASGIKHALRSAGLSGAVAGAVWMGSGLAAAGWRALSLSERALAGAPGRAHWACRLALAALPLVAASVVTMTLDAEDAPEAVLLFAGGLVERSVRDLTAHALASCLPRGEMTHPEGGGIAPALRTHIEWARAIQAMPRTFVCATLQVGLALGLAPAVGEGFAARAGAQALGSGLLEAARGVINHQATEDHARLHGLVVRPHAGQGVQHALTRAADVCCLRETLAIPSEIIQVLAGSQATAGGQAAMALGLGALKGLGEARTALVNLGRAAGARSHSQLERRPWPATEPSTQTPTVTTVTPTRTTEPPLEAAESDLSPVPPPA